MKATGSKWYVLAVSTMSSFITPFMGSSVNIALPTIGKEFAMDAVLLGWVPTSFVLASAIFLLPLGRIADIRGRKRIFTWGVFIYLVSSLGIAASVSAAQLIALRVFQGIGGAMIFGTGVAMLTSVFPAGQRGRALGINVAAVYIGLSMGPFLGGMLTQYFGWRSIFLAMAPLCLITIVILLWGIKDEWAPARGERFDLPGSLIYCLALVALMTGFSRLPASLGFVLVCAGCAGLAVFVRWELSAEHPVLEMGLFKNNAVFTFSNLAALINYSATAAVGFLVSLYLQYLKGLDPRHAGLIMVSMPAVMALFSPLAGRLSDGVQPRILSSLGMALTSLGLFLFIFISQGMSLWYVIVCLVIGGLGFSLFSSPNTNAVMSSVESKYYGVASATLGTMRLTGNMLSMGIVMLVFALYIGRVQITPESYGSFQQSLRVIFAIFTALCAAGVFLSLARGNVKR